MGTQNLATTVPANQPFVDQQSFGLSRSAFDFLLVILNRTGGNGGNEFGNNSFAGGLTATGSMQADALPVTSSWNEVDATPSGSGVVLQGVNTGQLQLVVNAGAHDLNVWPPPSMQIDGNGLNAAYSLAAGKMQFFMTMASPQIRTLQLG